jgi:hypothetical protein
MAEIETSPPPQPTPLNVVVTKMPEQPAKRLLQDPNRLLSLAAFVFSVSTGIFATYQTWKNSTEAVVENVSKLTDQYYEGQAKLAQLNASQTGYINLLRTTLRSTALRAIARASLVKKQIDEGTWLALAQINDNENNIDASQIAWAAAAENTKELAIYIFGMRGLAANRIKQGDSAGAEKAFTAAITASLADKFKDAPNKFPVYYRNLEAGATQAYWLSSNQTADCAFISEHFDIALTYLAEANRTQVPTDYNYLTELVGTRAALNYMRKARENCPPINAELFAQDECNAIADVADNARYGFPIYRGVAVTPSEADSDSWSLYYLVDVERCVITKSSNFHCSWPEQDETGTAERMKTTVDRLMACKNFANMKKSVSTRENSSRISQVMTLSSDNKASIRVLRSYWKPSPTREEEWAVTLQIDGR